MGMGKTIWASPAEFLRKSGAAAPVLFFAPHVLQATARRFIDGFPGLVTYAVKANPDEEVIANLSAAGVRGFDVASPVEIGLIRRLVPNAALHFNNPVRSRAEVAAGVAGGVASWSVDSESELRKLFDLVPPHRAEIAVRFKLPVKGATYDFGAKFGATPDLAAHLLRLVAEGGYVPALSFHPGTQCTDAQAWTAYIGAAAAIAHAAGVRIARLNVGGGFPSHRMSGPAPALDDIFACIARQTDLAFGADKPVLVCEPGRGLVADAFSLVTEVKAVRDGEHVFLNDGVYGALSESLLVGAPGRIAVHGPDGDVRPGAPRPRTVFGPTCDSVDKLPGQIPLPEDIAEGDHVTFHGMGAYSSVTATRFNGFGTLTLATVLSLQN